LGKSTADEVNNYLEHSPNIMGTIDAHVRQRTGLFLLAMLVYKIYWQRTTQ
jgi:hypothetical protein